MWLMIARRSRSARSLGGDPWNVQPWWNAAPPGGTSIGTHSTSAYSSGGATCCAYPVQSSGAWN
jgi:hypothetical protein